MTQLRSVLATNTALSAALLQGVFAAHIVSAAVLAALAQQTDIAVLFTRMIQTLKAMHDKNPTWGPLAVVHRGNICKDFVYCAPRSGREKVDVSQV